eukprot:c23391_g1_i1 orf=537-875(+)
MSTPVKTCLCSPTSHAGSFRCRFHRALEKKWPHPVSPRYNSNVHEESSFGLALDSPPPLNLSQIQKQVGSPRTASAPTPVSTERKTDSAAHLNRLKRIVTAEQHHETDRVEV